MSAPDPRDMDVASGQHRDPKPRMRGEVRHPGRAFFWFLFFARAKKRNLPWVSHPQVIRRRRRHNVKSRLSAAFDHLLPGSPLSRGRRLDPGFHRGDNKNQTFSRIRAALPARSRR